MKPPGDPAGGLSRALRLPRVGPLALSFGLTFAPLTACADPMALWRIVHDACMPHVEAGEGPKPCESVDLAHGEAEGVAILKDLTGVAQMLAIPTRRITGIEDPQMLAPTRLPSSPTPGGPRRCSRRASAVRCRAKRSARRSTIAGAR